MEEIKQNNIVTVAFTCAIYANVDVDTGELINVDLVGETVERNGNEVYDFMGEPVDAKTAAEAEEIAWDGDWSPENLRWV